MNNDQAKKRIEVLELILIFLVLGLLIVFGEGCSASATIGSPYQFDVLDVEPRLTVKPDESGDIEVVTGVEVALRQLIYGFPVGLDLLFDSSGYAMVELPSLGGELEVWFSEGCYYTLSIGPKVLAEGQCD